MITLRVYVAKRLNFEAIVSFRCLDFQYILLFVFSDGYAYYEEWQNLVERSDREVKQLLEEYGKNCQSHGVRLYTILSSVCCLQMLGINF